MILAVLFVSQVRVGAAEAQVLKMQAEFGRVSIFSDGTDQKSTAVADNLYRFLHMVYTRTVKVNVESLHQLDDKLQDHFFINSYVFQGSLNGLRIQSQNVSWARIAEVLNQHDQETEFGPEEHILATGDGNLLQPLLANYTGFHVETSPVIDIRVSLLFYLWTIADILSDKSQHRTTEMLRAGARLRDVSIAYFSQDFNTLLSRAVDPVEVLGENQPTMSNIAENKAKVVRTYPTADTPNSELPVLSLGTPRPRELSRTAGMSMQVDLGKAGASSVLSTRLVSRLASVTSTNDPFVIVSIGDSIASGEGNPDVRGSINSEPIWSLPGTDQDKQCHRSPKSGPAMAATLISEMNSQPVQFIHLACSGASIDQGLLGPYSGIESGFPALPPQMEQARLLAGPSADALLISIGGNDIHFSDIVKDCVILPACYNSTDILSQLDSDLKALYNPFDTDSFDRLADSIKDNLPEFWTDPEKVFITSYPDPTRDQVGAYCSILGGITPDEAEWASNNVVKRLNEAVAGAAKAHRWTFVNVTSEFTLHGYCSDETYIRLLIESLVFQRGIDGTLHPNFYGHCVYRDYLVQSILKLSGPIDRNSHPCGSGLSDYVDFGELPRKSGIEGPVGKILDTIIEHLLDWLDSNLLTRAVGVLSSFLRQIESLVMNYVFGPIFAFGGPIYEWVKEHKFASVAASVFFLIDAFNVASGSSDEARAALVKFLNFVEGNIAKVLPGIVSKVNGWLRSFLPFRKAQFHLDFPIGFGDFSLFNFFLNVGLQPELRVDTKAMTRFVNQTLFLLLIQPATRGLSFSAKEFFSVFQIVVSFVGELGVSSFGSDKNGMVKYLLDNLGVQLKFSGSARFVMDLLRVNAAHLDHVQLFKIREWSFRFALEVSRRFTVFDFFTAGAGGEVLSEAAEYVGLGHFYIDVFFRVTVEMVRTFASAGVAEASKLGLEITVGMAADLKVAILQIKGALEVTLKFVQDRSAQTPLQILLSIHIWFKAKVDLYLADLDVGKWEDWPLCRITTCDPSHQHLISGGPGSPAFAQNALGIDTDQDGLSDDSEKTMQLDPNSPDTDGDGLNDKYELEVSRTMPDQRDSDGDGLSDGEEVNLYHSDPLSVDTDLDGLTDYEEVKIYGTSPVLADTDKDGLSDWYEINTSYSLAGTKLTTRDVAPFVTIGIGEHRQQYPNHTDPLNPDTDGDGLLDGEEGLGHGPYYGDPAKNGNDTSLFNFGYTHPLAYDTDGDSYEQYPDYTRTPSGFFYRDMNDGLEVHGQLVNLVNSTSGASYQQVVHTNPTNPDSDRDTAAGAVFLNGDGRELATTPPTDPTNGDTDSDGIIDGVEGTGDPASYHTNPNNPDTDGDGLPDGREIEVGTNPLNPDTDGDGVKDGDEVLKYHTNPLMKHTDSDTLPDGEELFQFYSDPLNSDSDNDTILDGYEAHIYGTDPASPDTDSDGIPDNVEIFQLGTNPLSQDTDLDGLTDLEETNIYHTSPLRWDTDNDSITTLDQTGQMALRLSDYDEVHGVTLNGVTYRTDPLAADTDNDGLTDGQELLLARGTGNMASIPLDPTNNDTDHDGLLDGEELRIQTVNTITYPFTAQVITSPFNSSAVNSDTDRDGLSDGEEVRTYRTNPSNNDTDFDTLTDYEEVHGITVNGHTYFTNPADNDTDGDGLADNIELSGKSPMPNGELTDPTLSDTDGDLLPDGAEVLFHHTDPLNPDTDGNGVRDGAQFDTDNDGLSDGEEFYTYSTNHAVTVSSSPPSGTYIQTATGSEILAPLATTFVINLTAIEGHPVYLILGGFNNPDSDQDGLGDGVEVHTYHTSPTNGDTDGDGYSDGVEVKMGTDPNSPSSNPASTPPSHPATAFLIQFPSILLGAIAGLAAGSGLTVLVYLRKTRRREGTLASLSTSEHEPGGGRRRGKG